MKTYVKIININVISILTKKFRASRFDKNNFSDRKGKMRAMSRANRVIASIVIALAFTGIYCTRVYYAQKDIAESLLRLHIVANSDTASDQLLKLQVRDDVTEYMRDIISGADTREQAEQSVITHLEEITEIAQNAVYSHGYDYSVTAQLADYNFPTKYYAGFALPAGSYTALKIEIGQAVGENWFCVLFPPLCFDGDQASMPDSGKRQLKKVLSAENYSLVAQNENDQSVKVKFKILEIFNASVAKP